MEKVKFDVETKRVDRSSAPKITNPLDLHAIEEAVRVKERVGGTITAISMGPPSAESTLRETLARGADKAVLLADTKFAGADTLATSYTLASAIRKLGGFDLIFCGEKTIDGDTGQVGPEVSEHLGIPLVTYVTKVLKVSDDEIVVESELDDYRYRVKVKPPVLLTLTKDANTPRLPSLRDVLRAKKAPVEVWSASDLTDVADEGRFGVGGSPTSVTKVEIVTEEGRKCAILPDREESYKEILSILDGEGVI